jgi:MFS family permease
MEKVKKALRDSVAARWMALVLVSIFMFGTYWFQDFFSGLKGLMESQMGFTSEEFGRLIGLTTIANMFGMIIVGGMILDKWSIRAAGLAFGGLATIGSSITAAAAHGFFGEGHQITLTMMIVGRIMFGSGLEVICVVATRTIVKWFKGYELALAMAINMGFGRLGTAIGMAVSIDIAKGMVAPAVSFAATLIGIGLILFVIYIIMDLRLDRQDAAIDTGPKEEFKFTDFFKLLRNPSFMYIAFLCLAFYAAVFPFIQYAPDLLVNKFGFLYDLPADGRGSIELFGSKSLGNASIIIAIWAFGLAFSMVPANLKKRRGKIISTVVILVLFVLFIGSLWEDTLSVWLKNGPKTASLIPLGTILFTPIFGNFVDRKGKAASLMILGSLLLIFAHVALSVFNSVALGYMGLLSLGIAFSLVPAAMWPSVAKIVAESRLGTAYATMFTIQNWGLGFFFWGIGAVLDLANKHNLPAIRAGEMVYNYTIPILMLVVCGIISIFLAYKLLQADRKAGYGLELPSGQAGTPQP